MKKEEVYSLKVAAGIKDQLRQSAKLLGVRPAQLARYALWSMCEESTKSTEEMRTELAKKVILVSELGSD